MTAVRPRTSANVRGARPDARRRASRTSADELTLPRSRPGKEDPTSTRPGRPPVAARHRGTRRRTARSQSFEITVTGKRRPDPDLDLIARALLTVARELALKARQESADDHS